MGRLTYKLKPIQRRIKDVWEKSKSISHQFVGHIGRQTGKTYLWNVIAIELALRNSGANIVVVAPVEKKLASFIKPILNTILADCPLTDAPEYLEAKNQLVFSNGAVVHYFGSHNDNYNAIRGLGSVNFILIDEAGFVRHLDELVAVVAPMLLRTNGFLVYSSSSPETLDHRFWALVDQAMFEGWYLKLKTSEDETVTEETLDTLAKLLGGKESSRYRREVLCERIVEKTKQVLPEWDSTKYVVPEIIVEQMRNDPNYFYFNHIVSFDPGHGGSDPNCVTFGTYLFGSACFLIEDELIIAGRDITTDKLVFLINEKVKKLWGNSQRIQYWADPSNQTLLNDMAKLHNMPFAWTAKDKKELALESMRTGISQGGLLLSEKCVAHKMMFENTIWNEAHNDFEHSIAGYHGDAIDSTLYAYRNLNRENPLPAVPPLNWQKYFINPTQKKLLEEQNDINKTLFESFAPEDYPES